MVIIGCVPVVDQKVSVYQTPIVGCFSYDLIRCAQRIQIMQIVYKLSIKEKNPRGNSSTIYLVRASSLKIEKKNIIFIMTTIANNEH